MRASLGMLTTKQTGLLGMLFAALFLSLTLLPARLQQTVQAQNALETVEGLEVTGSPEFIVKTKEALDSLKHAKCFKVVKQYIAVIKESETSGMEAWLVKPSYGVGKRTWQAGAVWYASTIAHDAFHSKLYHDAKDKLKGKEPSDTAWTGKEAEKKCLRFQADALRQMRAEKRQIDYVIELQKNPTYQDGKRDW
jgi:hypothetical protein